jgi:hypothetical protein
MKGANLSKYSQIGYAESVGVPEIWRLVRPGEGPAVVQTVTTRLPLLARVVTPENMVRK